jgi:hypothetical protein
VSNFHSGLALEAKIVSEKYPLQLGCGHHSVSASARIPRQNPLGFYPFIRGTICIVPSALVCIRSHTGVLSYIPLNRSLVAV